MIVLTPLILYIPGGDDAKARSWPGRSQNCAPSVRNSTRIVEPPSTSWRRRGRDRTSWIRRIDASRYSSSSSPAPRRHARCSLLHFYRATLCVSAVFAVVRCPSVCPSETSVDCIHMAEDIVKLLVCSGRPITLVFDPLHRYSISRGTPSAEAQNTRGGKIGDFRLKSPFISETVRDRPIVTMEP